MPSTKQTKKPSVKLTSYLKETVCLIIPHQPTLDLPWIEPSNINTTWRFYEETSLLALFRRLEDTRWGARATILRTTTLTLV